jgi:Fe2+ transport system protein FeoA
MFGFLGKREKKRPEMDLLRARCGERLQVVGLRAGSQAALRLLELGFCRSAEVCKLSEGGACLCLLRGMRVAIGRDLASDVLVERVTVK